MIAPDTTRLERAFLAIAAAVHADGWRMYRDDGRVVHNELARRTQYAVFRRVREDGSVDSLRVSTTFDVTADGDRFDLDTLVTSGITALRARDKEIAPAHDAYHCEPGYVYIDRDPDLADRAEQDRIWKEGRDRGAAEVRREYEKRARESVKFVLGHDPGMPGDYACTVVMRLGADGKYEMVNEWKAERTNPSESGQGYERFRSLAKSSGEETTTTTLADLTRGMAYPMSMPPDVLRSDGSAAESREDGTRADARTTIEDSHEVADCERYDRARHRPAAGWEDGGGSRMEARGARRVGRHQAGSRGSRGTRTPLLPWRTVPGWTSLETKETLALRTLALLPFLRATAALEHLPQLEQLAEQPARLADNLCGALALGALDDLILRDELDGLAERLLPRQRHRIAQHLDEREEPRDDRLEPRSERSRVEPVLRQVDRERRLSVLVRDGAHEPDEHAIR